MEQFRIRLAIAIINVAMAVMPKEYANKTFINNLMLVGFIEVEKD